MFPRYVVSYALSIVCAQQLKAAYDADPADGWRYHALCASGGSKLYAETLSDAGLPLPYAPGVVESLAQAWPASSGDKASSAAAGCGGSGPGWQTKENRPTADAQGIRRRSLFIGFSGGQNKSGYRAATC